ncbi:MAG: hypothetical protein NZO58_10465, partial [Gemmataceae bacterium]|nr:hypothetical protein [Gemmataceae bacterium]
MEHPPEVPRTVEWVEQSDQKPLVRLLDQTRLPAEIVFRDCRRVGDIWLAIRELAVRGAPAIGIAAAMGLALETYHFDSPTNDPRRFLQQLGAAADYLRTSRPTAVNLFWALDRLQSRAESVAGSCSLPYLRRLLRDEALAIEAEDRATCLAIGRNGAALIPHGAGVLTHCNAGSLATAGLGTALAAIYVAQQQGKRVRVFVDETRPLLQGAR